jgi:predicted Ser/Thr protein kinase
MPDVDKDPLLGRRIGQCALQRKLGQGGMGAVYLAHHAGLNKPVALKILPEALAKNPDYIARFLREARLAARLDHPNVVQVFDVGQSEELYYITMQYVEGRSLDVLLKERGKLSANEALSVAKRVAAALDAARRLGITHRDIKPANILISKDGFVKVADFGLAKERASKGSISETGQILGTPHYMAPEQAEGKAVDSRTDLYALGATLYHMVTGQKPFDGPTPLSVVVKALKDDPVPPRQIDPSIPEGVQNLVLRLMSKSPDARPATGEEVARIIDALKAGSSPGTAILPPKRRAAMVALPVAAILIVGIVLGMVLARPRPEPEKPAPPPAAARPAPPPKPAPAPEKPVEPAPASRRQTILDAMKDAQERRLTEEVMDRTEALLKALKARDVKAIKELTDRLTFGDSGEALAGEVARRILEGDVEILAWDFEDVEIRTRTLGRSPHARVNLTYEIKGSQGKAKVEGAPIHWVRRIDGGWFLTRGPRSDNK